jgi:anti-sigma B factor antagonist/stage II sporulation protein AA (anti-sigma F factor antagonist)
MELSPRRFGDTIVLAPAGRIDHGSAEEFRIGLLAELARCVADGHRVVLDFSGVEYIASVGLRALVLASKQVKVQGGTLVVAALQPVVQEIFDITRFNVVLPSFASLREALVAVSPPALAVFDRG